MLFTSPNRRVTIIGLLCLIGPARPFCQRFSPGRMIHLRNLSMSKKKHHNDFDGLGYGLGSGLGSSHTKKPVYNPKGENQKKYCELLENPSIPLVFGIGPAGCGKTLFACITAMKQYNLRTIDKIILTRPIIPVDEEDIGFLPGNMINKMDPWIRPIFDIFEEYYSKTELAAMLKAGVIEICPLAYMRGRTFKRSFIIADEMQNSSPNQMKMLTTRVGDDSKMVVMGDLHQGDRGNINGLADIIGRYNRYSGDDENDFDIGFAMMDSDDIQRSRLVVSILKLYDGSGSGSGSRSLSKENGKDKERKTIINDAALIPIRDEPISKIGKDFGEDMGLLGR